MNWKCDFLKQKPWQIYHFFILFFTTFWKYYEEIGCSKWFLHTAHLTNPLILQSADDWFLPLQDWNTNVWHFPLMSFNFLNHSFLLWSRPSRKPDLISVFIHIFHCTYSWSYFWVLTDYFIVFYNMQRKLAKTTRQRDLINDSICLRTVSFKSWGEYYLVCSQESMPTLLHFLFKPTPPKTPSASRSVCQKHMLICGSFWPEFLHRFNFKDSRFLA